MEIRELSVNVTRNGKEYELLFETRGSWSGHYRAATSLDPEEFPEFEVHDFRFLSAKGLLEDVVTENSPDAFQWISMVNPFSGEDRFESLDVTVEFGSGPLTLIYDRDTPLEAFKLSTRTMFITELEEYVLNLITGETNSFNVNKKGRLYE